MCLCVCGRERDIFFPLLMALALLPYLVYYEIHSNTARNIGVHISFWIIVFLFSSNKYSGVELLNHLVVLFSLFWGTAILFSIVAAPVYIPTNSAQGFPFFHILTNIFISCHFDNSHSVRCEVNSSLWFWFALPLWLVMLHLFMYLMAILMTSLEKHLLRPSAIF